MRREWSLAMADIRHDAVHFLCAIILIASIVGQFLILLGMKSGAITVLLGDLRDNPSNLEVSFRGAGAFTAEDVTQVRNFPGVAFAEGQNLVTTTGRIKLIAVNGDRSYSGGYGTTGPGDPYTALGAILSDNELILSAAMAKRMKVDVGDSVRMLLDRSGPAAASIEPVFSVAEVMPDTLVAGNFMLLNASTLATIEAFGFGYAIPRWGVDSGRNLLDRVDSFEKIRTYADNLESLPDLVRRIETAFSVQTSSNESQVRLILTLERNLNNALAFVTGAGLVGLFFVLAAHFWSAVRRKRLSWSMMSLMGASPKTLAAIPVMQALIVSFIGFLGGVLLFVAVLALINSWFRPFLRQDESVAAVSVGAIVVVGVAVMAMSACASALAGAASLRSDPAEVIRSA